MTTIEGTIQLDDGTTYNINNFNRDADGDDDYSFYRFHLVATSVITLPSTFKLTVGNVTYDVYDAKSPGNNNFYTVMVNE